MRHEAWHDLPFGDGTAARTEPRPWSRGRLRRAARDLPRARGARRKAALGRQDAGTSCACRLSRSSCRGPLHPPDSRRASRGGLREDLPFAPGDGSIEAIADDWRDQILAGRSAAETLPHYRELRYERLVNEPEPCCASCASTWSSSFATRCCESHERARGRLGELPEERPLLDGVVTRAERISRHANVMRPPDPALAERWRMLLGADEVARFEDRAGGLPGGARIRRRVSYAERRRRAEEVERPRKRLREPVAARAEERVALGPQRVALVARRSRSSAAAPASATAATRSSSSRLFSASASDAPVLGGIEPDVRVPLKRREARQLGQRVWRGLGARGASPRNSSTSSCAWRATLWWRTARSRFAVPISGR